MPDDPKIDVTSFTPKQRREYIAYRLLGNPNEATALSINKVTGKSLSNELGVSTATICEDLKSDEVLLATRDAQTRFIKMQVLPKALKNIFNRVMQDEDGEYSLRVAHEFGDLISELRQRGLVVNVLFGNFQDRLVVALADRMIAEGIVSNPNGRDNGNGNDGSEVDCRQLVIYHPPDAGIIDPPMENGAMG